MENGNELKQVTMSLQKSDIEKLDRWAKEGHLRRSAVIRVMIAERWAREQEGK